MFAMALAVLVSVVIPKQVALVPKLFPFTDFRVPFPFERAH
jgi:hypothetical protein